MRLSTFILSFIAMVEGIVVFYQISRLNQMFPSIIAVLLFTAVALLFISRIISLLVLAFPRTLPYMHLVSSAIFCVVLACAALAIKILADGWRELKN